MEFSLKINGVEQKFAEDIPSTLTELLKRLKIDQATVVAEVDGQVIARIDFEKTPLASGSSIELVRFVGGG